jgi:hypothetical protein
VRASAIETLESRLDCGLEFIIVRIPAALTPATFVTGTPGRQDAIDWQEFARANAKVQG